MAADGPPRILVLVLALDREPWRTIEREGQRRTWAAPENVPAGCRVIFYEGRTGLPAEAGRVLGRLARSSRAAGRAFAALSTRVAAAGATLEGDRLRTRAPEAYTLMLPKLLAALRWADSGAAGSFDYVLRANTSAYVVLDRLQELARGLPATACYAGWLGNPPPAGPPFVKGGGILLSRDVAEAVARDPGPWPWGAADDAALAPFLLGSGIEPISLPRTLARGPADVAALPEDELRSAFLFRCKSQGGARVDHLTMQALHARLGQTD
jgi:hypothetical protein